MNVLRRLAFVLVVAPWTILVSFAVCLVCLASAFTWLWFNEPLDRELDRVVAALFWPMLILPGNGRMVEHHHW